MFQKILIANRGEIACRIIQTARKMGIQTVAVYSEADQRARHVDLADEAVYIGPAPSRDSYLQINKIIAACKATGAQAVHPGYGFLSENQAFAKALEEQGLVFIGPKSQSIAAMGDKIASKKLALTAKVNTIPGHNETIADAQEAVGIAQSIGYPVMIKASAGGGGKGLRVAFNDQEALDGFGSCQNEARNSFGDDRIFIEKYVEEPRHIEIQVLGDSHGNVLYLNERECSIQRRHQKVIEEAPSPFISEATRQAMGEQAIALAKAVDYQSAGTVEFVVGKDQSFYFLEMNTRLQVEHPVTELVTGVDLVEWMIRIAAGETLTMTQAQVPLQGWAIECRINAENPYRGFLPSIGRLVHFQPPAQQLFAAEPAEQDGVRVDTGVQEGGEISMHYDSMIAKLIVHGRDRTHAIALMRQALNAFVIRGISSNIPFQAALLQHPDFVSGNFNTGFIAENYPNGFRQEDQEHEKPEFLVALAAFLRRKARERSAAISGQMRGHEVKNTTQLTGVILDKHAGQHGYYPVQVLSFDEVNNKAKIEVCSGDEVHSFELQSDSKLGDILMQGVCNGQAFSAQVENGDAQNPLAMWVLHNAVQTEVLVLLPHVAKLYQLMLHKAAADMSRFLLAPMPGLLTQIAVVPGQEVQADEKLATIEAMKMENTLLANQRGVVKKIAASVGASLAVDEVILEFEEKTD